MEEGAPASCGFFLYRGAVEIFHSTPDGRSTIVKLVTAPTLLGSPELLGSAPEYCESIRSAGEATYFRLERARFLSVLNENGAAWWEVARDLAIAFAGAARFEPSRLYDSATLLAALLVAYAEVFAVPCPRGVRIDLRRSQADLALAIGVTERQVNRLLSQWSRAGIIGKTSGRYVVYRPDLLKERAGALALGLVHRWQPMPELGIA